MDKYGRKLERLPGGKYTFGENRFAAKDWDHAQVCADRIVETETKRSRERAERAK